MLLARGYVGLPGQQLHYRHRTKRDSFRLDPPTPRLSAHYATVMGHLTGCNVIAVDTPGFVLSAAVRGN
jgi:hypothetical protein